MKALIQKELRLAMHPTVLIFLAFSVMLIIPSYPYYVPFFYTTLSIFFLFLSGRETHDNLFTALLPIRKRDCVRARVLTVVGAEWAMLLVSVPFAWLSTVLSPGAHNMAGIEICVALYGMVLVMYALFNVCFLPLYYKTAYRVGGPFVVACIAMFLYIVAAEAPLHIFPAVSAYLDTSAPEAQLAQLPVLAAGLVIYALLTALAYRLSASRFEKIDL